MPGHLTSVLYVYTKITTCSVASVSLQIHKTDMYQVCDTQAHGIVVVLQNNIRACQDVCLSL